ncbi:hypothetical protein PAP_03660 [Palaeococcus pacificus DY20341]|uniref:Glycosyltransferase RgtA/B/C/D-like domain-containing protein n=1 Tax=Palaeococcus pacificus DY20341 TaxID=1343739 RepID=A0A075LT80_9EURY|nr:glycosyltransferase family 39 protein [Palaeococcus pacificus]AIF69152.1 hypothetical protein PAP_03660 [Palaeococcus pacificus DY20341]
MRLSLRKGIQINEGHLTLPLLVAALVPLYYAFQRQMPVGYIVGGDTLVHTAIARGILLGRSPFLDQTYNIYPNWYPFFYHILIAGVSKLLNQPMEKITIYSPVMFSVLMVLVFYHTGKVIMDKTGGVISAYLSVLLLKHHIYPNPKELAPLLALLSFSCFVTAYAEEDIKKFVLSGILVGFSLFTHSLALPILAFLLFVSMYKMDIRPLVSLITALIIFSPFMVNVALHSESNNVDVEDIYNYWANDTIGTQLKSILPPFELLPMIILGVYVGLRRNNQTLIFLLQFFLVFAFFRILPSFTRPLGFNFYSARFSYMLPYIYLLILAFSFRELYSLLKAKKREWLLLPILILIVTAGAVDFVESQINDRFVPVSYININQYFPKEHFGDVAIWIVRNTKRDDIIACHENFGMMVNSLTGRPIIATMYGHGNPFLDNIQRRRDLEILFTSDTARKLEIIYKYNVRFIVVEPFAQEEWNTTVSDFNGIGKVVWRMNNVTIIEVNPNAHKRIPRDD